MKHHTVRCWQEISGHIQTLVRELRTTQSKESVSHTVIRDRSSVKCYSLKLPGGATIQAGIGGNGDRVLAQIIWELQFGVMENHRNKTQGQNLENNCEDKVNDCLVGTQCSPIQREAVMGLQEKYLPQSLHGIHLIITDDTLQTIGN